MKDYNTQKKIAIAALSVICLCLAAGLIYHLNDMDRTPAPVISADAGETVPEVTVLPIVVSNNDTASGDSGTIPQNTVAAATPTPQDETPAEEKPKTPAEATPPPPPKVTDEKAATDPAKPPEYAPEQTKPDTKTDKPKNGDKKDGKIYVQGFGWIVDEGGGGKGKVAEDMYENGNKIGTMD